MVIEASVGEANLKEPLDLLTVGSAIWFHVRLCSPISAANATLTCELLRKCRTVSQHSSQLAGIWDLVHPCSSHLQPTVSLNSVSFQIGKYTVQGPL